MTTAKFFTHGRIRPIRGICLHTMESQEKPDTAENVARWFSGKTSPQASAHFCVDNNSIVRVVDDTDTAWSVPSFNADGLHIEMAGLASQNKIQWADKYSLAVIENASTISANWCKKYSIPVHRLTDAEILDGKTKGFLQHSDATRAFKTYGGHTDIGLYFPWQYFLGLVSAKLK